MTKENAAPAIEETKDIRHTTDFGFLPIPQRLQYDEEKPFHFGLVLNASFGFASTFIVANLYYCQPLLIELAEAFSVTYNDVSRIPTLVQAGYATGILLLSPLGDLLRRRQLILALVTLSASLTIGLAVTRNLIVFETLSFLIGVVSVTPQVLLPLAADLAPPEKRASALSIVLSGLILGVLVARVLAGVIAEFAPYRVVYYMAIGVQYLVLVGCYWMLPDYPAKNKHMTYRGILWSMAKFCVTEPTLVQACLITVASAACFSDFWVTLTFLLGGNPFRYSTLAIGLFGLIGIIGVAMAPPTGKLIDGLVPWYASLFAILANMVFQVVYVVGAGLHIAPVVIATVGFDIFRQMLQVSLTTQVFSFAPEARARLNAILILTLFLGQVMGTSVGALVHLKYGWRANAGLMLAWTGWQVAILLARGPHTERFTWVGYQGGLEWRKSVVDERKREQEGVDRDIVGSGGDRRTSVREIEKKTETEKKEEA